ncbi:MAG: phosphatase PAP2 family protein [Oscillospiraceae bacterium]|nr:phosphatase PAP2 family protein [Oscillospiraceae bacterium]
MWQNYDVIELVQQLRSEFFDSFFVAVSFIIDMPLLMLVIAVLYWCVDKKYSVVITISYFIGSILNGLVKIIVQSPRPADPKIAILYGDSTKSTYSFPSGHSQYASSLATAISLKTYQRKVKHKWVLYIVSIFIALLGGFSRIYLGVHFWEDVVVGLVMGVVLMLVLIWAIGKIENDLWYIAFLVPLYIIMIFQPDHSLYGFVGMLTGVVVGYIIENRHINMQYAKCMKINIIRILCGYPLALGLYALRYFILANRHVAIDYFTMLAAGTYLTLAVPYLFTKVKLLRGTQGY